MMPPGDAVTMVTDDLLALTGFLSAAWLWSRSASPPARWWASALAATGVRGHARLPDARDTVSPVRPSAARPWPVRLLIPVVAIALAGSAVLTCPCASPSLAASPAHSCCAPDGPVIGAPPCCGGAQAVANAPAPVAHVSAAACSRDLIATARAVLTGLRPVASAIAGRLAASPPSPVLRI